MSDLGSTRVLGDLIVTGEIINDGMADSSHNHNDATTSASGFMSASDKTKLNNIATNANNYSHPTGDGNLHVPVTGTSSANKFLRAGSTAGSLSWSLVNWGDIGSKPSTFTPATHTHAIGDLTGVAASSHSHNYITGTYVSGGNELPSYFAGNKLKLQMLQGPTNWGWSDTLWMSSYAGGDVKGSNQLVISKTYDKIGFRRQNFDASAWGEIMEIYHTKNKPTAADVGAIALNTNIAINNTYPVIELVKGTDKARVIVDAGHIWFEGSQNNAVTSRMKFNLANGEMFIGNANDKVLTQSNMSASHTHDISQVTWAPSKNLVLSATAANQEWSIDMPDTTHAGTYFQIWSKKGNRGVCLKIDNDTGLTSIHHGLNVTSGGITVPATANSKSILTDASNFIGIKSHGDHTWLRNQAGTWTFQCGTAGDNWTESFQLYVPATTTGGNNTWVELGQRRTNDATNGGKYRGIRFVRTNANGAVGGADISLGTLFGHGGKVVIRTDDSWLRINDANSFTSGIYCGSSNLRTDGQFEHIKNNVTWTLNNGNSSYTHYATNAPQGHWFNTTVRVKGEIYAGGGYDQRVFHPGNLNPVKLYIQTGSVDISNTNLKEAYVTEANGNSSAPDTDWWHIFYMPHSNSNGYGGQIALSLNDNTKPMYVRTANGTTWGKWRAVGTADDNNYCRTFSRVYNAVWNDYAEYFLKEDEADNITPGEIVMVSEDTDDYVRASGAYNTNVVGVVSDSYGHILGGTGNEEQDERENVAIGLAGRVNVKIVGNIKKGDLIVCSDIPGVGMKSEAYVPGSVVGKAVENKTTQDIGLVKMFIMNI